MRRSYALPKSHYNARLMEVIERMECTNEGVEQTYESIMLDLKSNIHSFTDVAQTIEHLHRKHPERRTHLAHLYGVLALNNNKSYPFCDPTFVKALADIGINGSYELGLFYLPRY